MIGVFKYKELNKDSFAFQKAIQIPLLFLLLKMMAQLGTLPQKLHENSEERTKIEYSEKEVSVGEKKAAGKAQC